MTAPLLDVRDLGISFATDRGPLAVLREVSLAASKDRVLGLIGESGSGKSTLIAAILGTLEANGSVTGGVLSFAGRDLLGLGEEELAAIRGVKIAAVFQDPMNALNPVLSIATQLIDIQHRSKASRAEKRRRAIEGLEAVGIPEAARRIDDYSFQFSGGQRQRIMIAMALLMQPDLLIADEPTTALDATLEAQIVDLMLATKQRLGCALIFVSHDLGLIRQIADDVVVMYAGEVVEQGPAEEIFAAPAHPYTRLLAACDPALAERPKSRLPTIGGALPDLVRPPAGCIFAPRCPAVMAKCHETPPPDVRRNGRRVRCHLAAEETADG